MKKKGFTLIELLIVVSIIALLASVLFVRINQSKRNARVNNFKTSAKTALLMMVACLDSNGVINFPDVANKGGNPICNTVNDSKWPILANGYVYESVNISNSTACNFVVFTNGDSDANLTCSCLTQLCR